MKYRICLEIPGLAEDDQGRPASAGLCIEMESQADRKPTLEELRKALNISGILKMASLDGLVRPEAVRVISEEEYDSVFGEDVSDPDTCL